MKQSGGAFETADSLTPVHWLAIVLIMITGIIHIYAGLVEGRIPVSLAGIGFFGGGLIFVLDYHRAVLYPVGIVYTAVQFPLWYVAKAGEYTTLGYVDKLLQALLIVVLAYLLWQDRRTPEQGQNVTTA